MVLLLWPLLLLMLSSERGKVRDPLNGGGGSVVLPRAHRQPSRRNRETKTRKGHGIAPQRNGTDWPP
uniref:Putative secreted protein n=1 Tax=Anopheles marajoara TaxID=58244 RepID=A0A2M4CFG8_9DIPT